MTTLESIDTKLNRQTNDMGDTSNNVKEKVRKEREFEAAEEVVTKTTPDKELKQKPKPSGKRFDTANYTRSLQLASEAQSGVKFYGRREAVADYDGRDNNPADVMSGWDDFNETIQDRLQQERNLQHLVDEKGYHTVRDDALEDEANAEHELQK